MSDTENAPPIARDQMALKLALRQASVLYSYQGIIDAAKKLAPDNWDYTREALAKFVEKNSSELNAENFRAIAAFWLHSPLGRALRYLPVDPKSASPFERLARAFHTPRTGHAPTARVDGVWLAFHGSYLKKGHFVARRIEIATDDDGMIGVTDIVPDTVNMGNATMRAHGTMVFTDDRPQILVYGRENKIGFTLMTATDIVFSEDGGTINEMLGSLHVLNKDRKLAERRFLMLRWPKESEAAPYLKVIGMFTRAKMPSQYEAAFNQLATHEPAGLDFPDPILSYQL